MTEISVSTPEDWRIEETSDGLIRLSIREQVSLWHPYDFGLMAASGSHLATKIMLDRLDPEEPHDPT